MTGRDGGDRAGAALEGAAAAVLGVAIVAAWMGGWHASILGVGISVRALWRPLIVAGVLIAARFWLVRREEHRPDAISLSTARITAGALIAAGALSWVSHLSPYVGGADSYGYVSAAERIRRGALIQPEPLASVLPYPDGIFAATPLGYVPAARVPASSVPAYPLGLPLLMAGATALFGMDAAFYVPLVMGFVLIGVAYALTSRWSGDRVVALTAAAALTCHPVVFAYAIQAMSDVPATALYLLAAALVAIPTAGAAFAAGLAGGLAFLMRTALLPGVAALVLIARLKPRATNAPLGARATNAQLGSRAADAFVPAAYTSALVRWRRPAAFAGALAIAVAIQAWLQWYLYGHPLGNAYGTAGDLFSIAHLPINLRSYGYWGLMMHGPIWLAGFIGGLFTVRDLHARLIFASALVAAVVPYAIYRPYDHWETQRFILPLLVVATIFATAGLFAGCRRFLREHGGTWAALFLTMVMMAFWVRWLDRENVLTLATAEERFSQAGELVSRATPGNAVILASLHSGSLRFYSHRHTVDWAKVPAGKLDETAQALAASGVAVFVLLDGEEERTQFEVRHGQAVNNWLPAGQRRDIRLYEFPR